MNATTLSISKHRIANITGIPHLINWLHRQRLLVVTYHGVYDRYEDAALLPPTFVHVSRMKDQLSLLKDRYHVIRPEALLDAIVAGQKLPDHAALVTFDDAYGNLYELAAPLLESLNIVPIVFVPTLYVEKRLPFWYDLVWYFLANGKEADRSWFAGLIGIKSFSNVKNALTEKGLGILKRKPFLYRNEVVERIEMRVKNDLEFRKFLTKYFLAMTPDQIRRLCGRGFCFGGHTHTHTILTAMDSISCREEISQNKSVLDAMTGKETLFFAYPNGGCDDFNDHHKEMLTLSGYVSAFSLIQCRTSHLSDPLTIGRINVAPEDDSDSFWLRCTGTASLFRRIHKLH
ncbi:MAG: hypothetical protein VR64_23440 [Desulfatitalea sp. BRH_c12]|nr:MAG: hypothetical protein VR64_23440 [Desulfatitalea sp. BRH_c12]